LICNRCPDGRINLMSTERYRQVPENTCIVVFLEVIAFGTNKPIMPTRSWKAGSPVLSRKEVTTSILEGAVLTNRQSRILPSSHLAYRCRAISIARFSPSHPKIIPRKLPGYSDFDVRSSPLNGAITRPVHDTMSTVESDVGTYSKSLP